MALLYPNNIDNLSLDEIMAHPLLHKPRNTIQNDLISSLNSSN